jgi:TPR repeat protein
MKAAKEYYYLAIQYHNDPDAHYGIAELLLQELNNVTSGMANITTRKNQRIVQQQMKTTLKAVVYHLESAAIGGNVLAMFNLGIAHTYGYGIYDERSRDHPIVNYTIAVEWFLESGLPEGYYTASFQAASMNDVKLQKKYMERAMTLGYGAPWRQTMRQHTGSGRLANVDINLLWPVLPDGRKPPQF